MNPLPLFYFPLPLSLLLLLLLSPPLTSSAPVPPGSQPEQILASLTQEDVTCRPIASSPLKEFPAPAVDPRVALESMEIVRELKAKISACLRPLIPSSITHGAFIGVVNHENKGDSALYIATMDFLEEDMGIKIVFQATHGANFVADVKKNVRDDGTGMVFYAPGGNLGDTWPNLQESIDKLARTSPTYPILVLPNSGSFKSPARLASSKAALKAHPAIAITARDVGTMTMLRDHFAPNVTVKMCPDMAFYLGQLRPDSIRSRTAMAPVDIVWLKRGDLESQGKAMPFGLKSLGLHACTIPGLARDVIVDVNDWLRSVPDGVQAADATLRSRAQLRLQWAVNWLTRGRIVIADRLHAVILSHLAGHPSIALDNSYRKVFNFIETWLTTSKLVSGSESTADAFFVALKKILRATDGRL